MNIKRLRAKINRMLNTNNDDKFAKIVRRAFHLLDKGAVARAARNFDIRNLDLHCLVEPYVTKEMVLDAYGMIFASKRTVISNLVRKLPDKEIRELADRHRSISLLRELAFRPHELSCSIFKEDKGFCRELCAAWYVYDEIRAGRIRSPLALLHMTPIVTADRLKTALKVLVPARKNIAYHEHSFLLDSIGYAHLLSILPADKSIKIYRLLKSVFTIRDLVYAVSKLSDMYAVHYKVLIAMLEDHLEDLFRDKYREPAIGNLSHSHVPKHYMRRLLKSGMLYARLPSRLRLNLAIKYNFTRQVRKKFLSDKEVSILEKADVIKTMEKL